MSKSLAELYNQEVYKRLNYHGTWSPSEQWHLGDVLTIEKGTFTHKGENLIDYGVDFNIEEGEEKTDNSMSFSSTGSNETIIDVSADVTKVGKAQVKVAFSNEFGVIFKTKGYKISRIQKQGDVGDKIKKLYQQDPERWKKRVVIMELVQVNSGTILISYEKNSSLTIEGKVEEGKVLDIADAKLGITSHNKIGAIMEYIATSNLTPLFKLGRPSKAWFLGNLVVRHRSTDPVPEGVVEGIDFNQEVGLEDLE